jgi:hypothetical protein
VAEAAPLVVAPVPAAAPTINPVAVEVASSEPAPPPALEELQPLPQPTEAAPPAATVAAAAVEPETAPAARPQLPLASVAPQVHTPAAFDVLAERISENPPKPVPSHAPTVEAAPAEPEAAQLSLALPVAMGSVIPDEAPAAEPQPIAPEPQPLALEPQLVVEEKQVAPLPELAPAKVFDEPRSQPEEVSHNPLLVLAESVRHQQAVGTLAEPVAEPVVGPVPEPVVAAEQVTVEAAPTLPSDVPAEPVAAEAMAVLPIPVEEAIPSQVAAIPSLVEELVAPAPLVETVSRLAPPKPQPPVSALATPGVVPEAAPVRAFHPLSTGPAPGLALAPLQDFSSSLARSVRPARPDGSPIKPDTSPRITLPGPTLPNVLQSLQGAGLATVVEGPAAARAKKARGSSWLVSVTVMLVLLGIGVAGVSWLTPHSAAETKIASGDPEPAPSPAAASAATNTSTGSHPLTKLVEVTGFRIVVDFNRKSEIHYLLVNHSPTELDDVTISVTLRAASAKPGQPALCRFNFRAAGLGPFESKEMVSPIEKPSRSVTLPEWQDLRAARGSQSRRILLYETP